MSTIYIIFKLAYLQNVSLLTPPNNFDFVHSNKVDALSLHFYYPYLGCVHIIFQLSATEREGEQASLEMV